MLRLSKVGMTIFVTINNSVIMHSLLKPVVLFVLLLCSVLDAFAQWNHFVTNFKKELYGKGTQTWQIKTYDTDYIYFANKNGLLEYNGCDWKLFSLDNRADVRSIYVSEKKHRVYAGGESEFGYFEPGQNGSLIYTPLSVTPDKQQLLSEGFWGIYEVDHIVYYVSDRHIVKQIGDDFTIIPSEHKIDCSTVINNILYLGTFDGIKMLVGNTIFPHPEGTLLKGKTIRSIVPNGNEFLVATAFDGLFQGKDSEITPLVTGYEDFMSNNELFSLAVSDKYLAIGTVHRGLLLLDKENHKPYFFNEENGLQNNTVLSLAFDKRGNIWLGLDNGIDYINLSSPFTNLYTYPNSRGTGYVSLIKEDKLYLGTNRGLYYTQWPVVFTEKNVKTTFLPKLSGQVWGLKQHGDAIFCMHDKGLYVLHNGVIEEIPGLRGALSLIPHETDPNKCWIATSNSFFLLEKKADKWRVTHQLPEICNWPKNVVFESPEVLWVRRLNKGMERFSIDTIDYKVKNLRMYTQKDGLASIVNLYVHKIKNELYFSSDSGFFTYDAAVDKIVRVKEFNDTFTEPVTVLKECNNRVYALSNDKIEIAALSPSGVLSHPRVFSLTGVKVDLIRYYEAMSVVNDSLVIIPNEQGFALLNTTFTQEQEKNDLFIKRVYITYPKDSLIYENNFLNRPFFPSIDYRNNALKIEYDIRSFEQNRDTRFRYRLSPDDFWSEQTLSTVKEYNNLKEGDYTFEVEAIMENGQTASTSFSFTVLPPWYRSVFVKCVYLLLIFLFLGGLYLFEEWRLARKKRNELAAKENELHFMEQEYQKESVRREQRIVELKNENLEQELNHKNQEMANLMINFSRKNEILMDIKEELNKIMNELKGEAAVKPKRMLIALNNQIDTNIQSDDILKRFEEQFDLVHNNFISRIRTRHPDLTVSELKMCSYLKMNLSSKEIAPLLNLSVRGVETLRYRLRKKLGLIREENLMEYLNDLKD